VLPHECPWGRLTPSPVIHHAVRVVLNGTLGSRTVLGHIDVSKRARTCSGRPVVSEGVMVVTKGVV
jgi:hypothetical protein